MTNPQTILWTCVYLVGGSLAGCKTASPAPAAPGETSHLSSGYALLHELVDKQSGVGQALILGGGMSEQTKTLVKEIAQTSKEAAQSIKAFSQADPTLRLDDKDLPWVEQKLREEEESQTTSRMVFAGKKFEFCLLLSQVKSMPYGALLAEQLASIEQNKERREWLKRFAKQYGSYRDRAEERLMLRGDE